MKQIYDFEEVFKDKVSNEELLIQLENTIISENPLSDEEIKEEHTEEKTEDQPKEEKKQPVKKDTTKKSQSKSKKTTKK